MTRPEPNEELIGLGIFLVFITLIEWMAFRLLKRKFDERSWWKTFSVFYRAAAVMIWVCFIVSLINYDEWLVRLPSWGNVFSIAFFVNMLPKLFMAIFQLLDDLRYAGAFSVKKVTKSENPISRSSFLNTMGAGIGALTFSGVSYGVLWGKYAYRVERVPVSIKNLPSSFKGLRIAQISDAHLGSFVGQPDPVLKALQSINDLKPDIIVFTGDLVNTYASEAEPWIEAFAKLEAPMGKFSILGNHDYGEYGRLGEEDRVKSYNRLLEIHDEMGFRLLLDEHEKLVRGEDEIILAGVHNWGKSFVKKGNLEKALAGSGAENIPTVLLSHDPTHFEEQIMGGKAPVDLTLSGHTHGMQVGIEIKSLGIKFSPVSMLYKRWAGLYKEREQYLHVNRGFGVLAFRGRVGMPPEITLLELV
jgi:predicted MPP superfamily phosphohydrolase